MSLFGATQNEAVRAANLTYELERVATQYFDGDTVKTAKQVHDDLRLIEAIITANAVEQNIANLGEYERSRLSKRLTNIVTSHRDLHNGLDDLNLTDPRSATYSLDNIIALTPRNLLGTAIHNLNDNRNDDLTNGRVFLENAYIKQMTSSNGGIDDIPITLPRINYTGPISDVPGKQLAHHTPRVANAWKAKDDETDKYILMNTTADDVANELIKQYKQRLAETGTPRPDKPRITVRSRLPYLLANKQRTQRLIDKPDKGKIIEQQIACRELRSYLHSEQGINVNDAVEQAREILDVEEARAMTLEDRNHPEAREEGKKQRHRIETRREALTTHEDYLHERFDGKTIEEITNPGPTYYTSLTN